jgi:hypothetical protein
LANRHGGLVAAASGLGRPTRQMGGHAGANPVDRGKAGSKLHVATDAEGLPLASLSSSANGDDSLLFEALVEEVPAVRTPAGRRRCRRYLARRGIKPRIARRGSSPPAGLGGIAGGWSGRLPGWGVIGALACGGSLLGPVLRLPEVACTLVCFKVPQHQL